MQCKQAIQCDCCMNMCNSKHFSSRPFQSFKRKTCAYGPGPGQRHWKQSGLWSRLHTTLAQIKRITPKWISTEYTVLKIFLQFRFLSNLRLPWKIQFGLEFFTVFNIFSIIQDFWATCNLPWKQSLPWNFSSWGRAHPVSYAYGCCIQTVSLVKSFRLKEGRIETNLVVRRSGLWQIGERSVTRVCSECWFYLLTIWLSVPVNTKSIVSRTLSLIKVDHAACKIVL